MDWLSGLWLPRQLANSQYGDGTGSNDSFCNATDEKPVFTVSAASPHGNRVSIDRSGVLCDFGGWTAFGDGGGHVDGCSLCYLSQRVSATFGQRVTEVLADGLGSRLDLASVDDVQRVNVRVESLGQVESDVNRSSHAF